MHDRVERHFVGEIANGIAWATLNRPKQLNAFSDQMRDDLIAFLTNVEHDSSVRCLVLRGAGNHFMAGGDIKSFTEHMALDDARLRYFLSSRTRDASDNLFASADAEAGAGEHKRRLRRAWV